jgi:sulfite exporter TauE/SafE
MRILAYLLTRFSEPSSYAGLGALLALLGWNLPETVIGQLIQGLAAACALLALALRDRSMVPAIALVAAAAPALAA